VPTSPIPGKIGGFALVCDDVLRIETSGGGGLGDPLERDPVRVAEDVRLGYTSADMAHRVYGVALDSSGTANNNATPRLRDTIREQRVSVEVLGTDTDQYEGARRIFTIGRDAAQALRVVGGDLCELVNPKGPNLRGWVRVDEARGRGVELPLGPFGRAILCCAERGDRYVLRPVRLYDA
jgi:hypothetical protein